MPLMNDPNFLATLERMYKDAKLSFEKKEYYNCCYLSGYVLECALKYMLCTFGLKGDGTRYTIRDVKQFTHGIQKLNLELEQCISVGIGVPARYQFMPENMCPYIYAGANGYPYWNPKYRYGEHPMWGTEDWSRHYINELDAIFGFISSVVLGEEGS